MIDRSKHIDGILAGCVTESHDCHIGMTEHHFNTLMNECDYSPTANEWAVIEACRAALAEASEIEDTIEMLELEAYAYQREGAAL